jgi:hypothetical protein
MNTKCAARAQTTKIAPVEVEYSRFKITDDEKGKRYRIRWSSEGESMTQDFSYRVKSKTSMLEAATLFRASLIKEMFA